MELSNPTDLKLEFSEPKPLNIANLTKINIRREGKPVIIPTGKCFSYGVQKDKKYKTESMALVLDEATVKAFESVLSQCERHLDKPVSKFLYRRDDGQRPPTSSSKRPRARFRPSFTKTTRRSIR